MCPPSLTFSSARASLRNSLSQVNRATRLWRRQPRVIVYEQLKPRHIPILLLYYLLGYRQVYMQLNRSWRQKPWLRWVLAKLPVYLLSPEPLVYIRANSAGDRAFDIVDKVYNNRFSSDQRIGRLVRFFRSDDLHLAFKKSLLLELETFYYYKLLLSRISETLGADGQAFLVPADANVVRLYNACLSMVSDWDDSIHETNRIGFHLWLRMVSSVKELAYRFTLVGYWCYGILRLRLSKSNSNGGRERLNSRLRLSLLCANLEMM